MRNEANPNFEELPGGSAPGICPSVAQGWRSPISVNLAQCRTGPAVRQLKEISGAG
jgi:hypothetical protein